MPDTILPESENPSPKNEASSFLGNTPIAKPEDSQENLYNELFQDTGSGNITMGHTVEKSSLEVVVSILQYATTFIVIIGILSAIHIFIRSSQNVSFMENYPFLCPYLNYDIEAPSDAKGCKTTEMIKSEYIEKQKILEENIITGLTEYIPIKVSSNIIDASPEKAFAVNTYENKARINLVIDAFEKVKDDSQSGKGNNIKCTGITINKGYTLSTQCTVYGDAMGDASNRSARIQALQFVENLANTSKSSLIMENPPISLSIEKLGKGEQEATGFMTRTNLPIQVRYLPVNKKL